MRQLEELEVKLMATLAGHLRETSKLQRLGERDTEARLVALEQRQVQLEHKFSDLADMVQERAASGGRCADAASPPPPTASQLAGGCRLDVGGSSAAKSKTKTHVADDETEMLRQAMLQAEALERRLAAATAGELSPREAPTPPPPAAEAEKPCREAPKPRGGHNADRVAGAASVSELVLAAVEELESLMQVEVKALNKRFANLQDTIDERAVLPLRDLEQRLQEQDQKVRQLLGVGAECSSKVEEHEFRLGVANTKLEVHEQKISRLESLRLPGPHTVCVRARCV